MPASVRRTFSHAARTYGPAAAVQQAVAGTCASRCPAGEYGRVLDVGAGTGFLARALARRLSCRNLVALDLSRDMLRAHQEAAPGSLRVAADGEAAPFCPASFDLLVSASALQWFTRPERSLAALLELEVIDWLLMKTWTLLALSVLIIFQPEIRRAFAQLGSDAAHYATLIRRAGASYDQIASAAQAASQAGS